MWTSQKVCKQTVCTSVPTLSLGRVVLVQRTVMWLTVVICYLDKSSSHSALSASQIHEPIIPVMKTVWDNSVKLIGSFRTAARLYCTKLICFAFAFTLPDVLTPFQMLKYTMVKINNKQRVNCQLMPPRSSSPLDLCTCRTWRLKEERKTQHRYFFNKYLC